MSENSKIGWTDATWNPVRGCSKVSAGCRHCYAETFAERWRGIPGHPFEQGFDLRLVPEKLGAPLRWKKSRRIFVNSMSDLFHKDVPDSYIAQVFGVMAFARRHGHVFQVLTKRADRMLKWFQGHGIDQCIKAIEALDRENRERWIESGDEKPRIDLHLESAIVEWPLSNVWLGVSVEDQRAADERIPLLLQTPAAVRFLSCEPLLGPVDIRAYLGNLVEDEDGAPYPGRINWIIIGGESGHGARPCALEWIEDLIGQGREGGAAVFVKQLGTFCVSEDRKVSREDAKVLGCHPDGWAWRAGHPKGDTKGEDIDNWPAAFRVREFPGGLA